MSIPHLRHPTFLALAATLLAALVAAQEARPRELPSAGRMLQVFEEDAREDRHGGTEGVVAVQYAVTHPRKVAPARLDSLLAGLERLATASETRRARVWAVMYLGRVEDPANFERMMRIYRAASVFPEVRDMVMSTLPKPTLPRYVEVYVAFLRGLVVQPADAEDFPNAPFEAMRSLYALGDPGKAAMIEIHRRGLARNPEVRALLASWVRQDFRLSESAPGE